MADWNEKFNYFDDELLAKDWFNRLCDRLSWKFFENQEDVLYMAGELGEGALPKFKEGAIEKMQDVIVRELGWMIGCITTGFIESFRIDSNVDLSEEMEEWLIDEMGMEAYGEWEIEARNKIVDEYSKHLGREKALELAKKWWGENNGVR